jgi:hypothetical protein
MELEFAGNGHIFNKLASYDFNKHKLEQANTLAYYIVRILITSAYDIGKQNYKINYVISFTYFRSRKKTPVVKEI